MKSRETFLLVIVFIVGIILGGLFFYFLALMGLTGFAIIGESNFRCDFISVNANYEIIGETSCNGKGALFKRNECKIQLKNPSQEQSAQYQANFICRTLDETIVKQSDVITLAPSETKEVKIEFKEAGYREWKCDLTSIRSSMIKGCLLVRE